MAELTLWELLFCLIVFIWSGFVRTALGFGGAALSVPLFLFVLDSPVQIIPIIGLHLLLSALLSLGKDYRQIDWHYLGRSLPYLLPFKIAGVIGLFNLPANLLNTGVYLITLAYALSYITQTRWKKQHKLIDYLLLAVGSYVSGTSLIGAPLIIAVYSRYLAPNRLRATLFCLWSILVVIKLIGFIIADVSLQLDWALYTLPFAYLGHYLGEIAHQRILQLNQSQFMRWIGIGLLTICLTGIFRLALLN